MKAKDRDWLVIAGALFVIMALAIHGYEREKDVHMREHHPEMYEEMIEEGPEHYEDTRLP